MHLEWQTASLKLTLEAWVQDRAIVCGPAGVAGPTVGLGSAYEGICMCIVQVMTTLRV